MHNKSGRIERGILPTRIDPDIGCFGVKRNRSEAVEERLFAELRRLEELFRSGLDSWEQAVACRPDFDGSMIAEGV